VRRRGTARVVFAARPRATVRHRGTARVVFAARPR
jgi:hypothetical protein